MNFSQSNLKSNQRNTLSNYDNSKAKDASLDLSRLNRYFADSGVEFSTQKCVIFDCDGYSRYHFYDQKNDSSIYWDVSKSTFNATVVILGSTSRIEIDQTYQLGLERSSVELLTKQVKDYSLENGDRISFQTIRCNGNNAKWYAWNITRHQNQVQRLDYDNNYQNGNFVQPARLSKDMKLDTQNLQVIHKQIEVKGTEYDLLFCLEWDQVRIVGNHGPIRSIQIYEELVNCINGTDIREGAHFNFNSSNKNEMFKVFGYWTPTVFCCDKPMFHALMEAYNIDRRMFYDGFHR